MMNKKAELINKQLEGMDKKKAQESVAEDIAEAGWKAGGRFLGVGPTISSIVGQVLTPTMLGRGDEYVSGQSPKTSLQSSSMWSQSDIGTTKLDLAANLQSKGFKK